MSLMGVLTPVIGAVSTVTGWLAPGVGYDGVG